MIALILLLTVNFVYGQRVNVFLGTSGDHGQLSPAASYPFSMLSIGPQTYPTLHAGYEFKAKLFLGFTHNRIEGVGCRGSGGNLLITPFTTDHSPLIKIKESASPGYYSVQFANGISAAMTVYHRSGIEVYQFPSNQGGLRFDFSHTFTNGFIAEQHSITGNSISGWIRSGTTCREGAYKIYYYLEIDKDVQWRDSVHVANARFNGTVATVRIAFSSVSEAYARNAIAHDTFAKLREKSATDWKLLLNSIQVEGSNPAERNLFYSLLYRVLQSPYNISEPDGTYRATDGSLQVSSDTIYNGWSIWDNYRTQLPLLSIAYPQIYQPIINSIAGLYKYGKQNWATMTEPSNTVRTEHAMVILLDAYRKGYKVDFRSIMDSLKREADQLSFETPDKALESSYDTWAFAEILSIQKNEASKNYYEKASHYKDYWEKDFADLSKPDIDKFEARGMYQGTIWQYRWFVPFDQKGLVQLCGGDSAFVAQLNEFFDGDYYNAANEPDIEAPYLYNFSSEPWRSQEMIWKYAKDTVVQYYTDLNYRGINPQITKVYNNRPDALLQSMDDDAGAMSAWYVLAACGLSPACIGWPVYYLSVPLFRQIKIGKFAIIVKNFGAANKFIQSATLNGKNITRNWITQDEINNGGTLVITASAKPNKNFGVNSHWMTSLEK